eukprot:SAG11_NODE_6042_length_1402_cov_1.356869_2_plen_41_part_01
MLVDVSGDRQSIGGLLVERVLSRLRVVFGVVFGVVVCVMSA